MRNRYPLLSTWKEHGFQNFPLAKYDFIGRSAILSKSITQHVEDVINEMVEKSDNPLVTPENLRANILASLPQLIAWGASVSVARDRIFRGELRKDVLKDLGNKVLQQTGGGTLIFTSEQKASIRCHYEEMVPCIKEVRTKLEIPLVKQEGYDWGPKKAEVALKYFPEMLDIFQEEELMWICTNPSVSETAMKILTARLWRSIGRRISKKTIRNIISQKSTPNNTYAGR